MHEMVLMHTTHDAMTYTYNKMSICFYIEFKWLEAYLNEMQRQQRYRRRAVTTPQNILVKATNTTTCLQSSYLSMFNGR